MEKVKNLIKSINLRNNIVKNTMILIIGIIIKQLFNFFYKFSLINNLNNEDYSNYILLERTFLLFIPLSSFSLHAILTNKIRETQNLKTINKYKKDFASFYLITSILSSFIFIVINYFFLFQDLNLFFIIYLSLCLIIYSFTEFFVGIARGENRVYISAIISNIIKIFPGLLSIFSLFWTDIFKFNFFIILFGTGYVVSLIFAICTDFKDFRLIFHIKSLDFKFLKKNFKFSSMLMINYFLSSLVLWAITFFASYLLSDLEFKVFDIYLYIISITNLVANSFVIAISMEKSSKLRFRYNKNMKFSSIKLISLGITSLSGIILIILYLSKFDLYLVDLIATDLDYKELQQLNSIHNFRLIILLPAPFIIASFYYGIAQRNNLFKMMLGTKLISSGIFIITALVSLILSSIEILIIGIILEKISISVARHYYFKIKNKTYEK